MPKNEHVSKSVTLCFSPISLRMSDENESEPADEEEFEVENILDKRKRQARHTYFYFYQKLQGAGYNIWKMVVYKEQWG